MSPRANRYMQDNYVYHLTARCHDRSFLFKFARWRDEYRRRLRTALPRSGVWLLGECVTSNHVHLLVTARNRGAVSSLMQKLQGEFAECYNIKKRRSGGFWEGRYHCTIVQSGHHLWSCILYIDLNMVRAGVVGHPAEWPHCSYDEHVGTRQRYRLLNIPRLIELTESGGEQEFRRDYVDALDELLRIGDMRREPQWTESIAVGDREFVMEVAERVKARVKLVITENDTGGWLLREAGPAGTRIAAPGRLDLYDGAVLIR